MSNLPSNSTEAGKSCARPLTVLELIVVLEELDRVVGELEESMTEMALPFDEPSRFAACVAIAAASQRHD